MLVYGLRTISADVFLVLTRAGYEVKSAGVQLSNDAYAQ